MWDWQYYVEYSSHSAWMWGIIHIILSLPHNIAMGLNDVMLSGPLHTQEWEPMTITLQALSLVEKVDPVQVRFTLHLRDQQSMWTQDGCEVHMDSSIASSGSCFMVTWVIFKNHLLETCLAQNRKTMALRTLTTIDLFYFIMCDDPHEQEFIELAFDWGSSHLWLHITLEDPWPQYMILEVCWDGGLWTLSFWALTIS
jgi:hypothetical protein